MPRIDFDGRNPSTDLSYSTLLTCENNSCSLEMPEVGDIVATGSDDTSSESYLQGLLIYAFLGLAIFLGMLIYFLLLLSCRYCCCCCGYGMGLACCCYAAPSIKNLPENRDTGDTTCCCGCWGYVRDPDSAQGFSYPKWEVWTARILAWIAIAALVGFMIAVGAAGIHAVQPAAEDVTRSPQHLAAMALNVVPPAATFTTEDANVEIISMLRSVNDTIYATVNITAVRVALTCAETGLTSIAAPTSVETNTAVWSDAADDSKDPATDVGKALSDIVSGLGASFAALETFRKLFYETAALTGEIPTSTTPPIVLPSVSPVAPLVNYVALGDGSDALATAVPAVKAAMDGGRDVYAWTQVAGPKDLSGATTTAARAGIIAGTPASGAPTATAFESARDAVAALAVGAKPHWVDSGVATTLRGFVTNAAPSVATATTSAAALAAAWPPTAVAAFTDVFTSSYATGLNSAATAARAYPSASTHPADLATAASRAEDLTIALAPFSSAYVGTDVVEFRDDASDISRCSVDILGFVRTFNSSLLQLGEIVDGAETAVDQLDTAFEGFSTVFDLQRTIESAVQGAAADIVSSDLHTRFTAFAGLMPSGASDTATSAATTALADTTAVQSAVAAASAPAVGTAITQTSIVLGGYTTTLAAGQAAWAATATKFDAVASAVARLAVVSADMANVPLVCSDAPAQVCSADADCVTPGATCNAARVCLDASPTSTGTATPLVRCATTTECGAVSPTHVCGFAPLAPGSGAGVQSTAEFLALFDASFVDQSSLAQALATSMAPSNAFFAAGAPAALDDVTGDVTDGLLSLKTQVVNNAATVRSGIAPYVTLAVPDSIDRLKLLGFSFEVIPERQDVVDQTNAVKSGLDSVRNDALGTLNDFNSLLDSFDACLPALFTDLDPSRLVEIYQQDGLGSAAHALVDSFDRWSNCTDGMQTLFEVGLSFASDLDSLVKILNRVDTPAAIGHGPIYYLMNLADQKQVTGDSPLQYRYEKDINGNTYAGGDKCYTHTCLSNEIDFVYNSNIKDVYSDAPVAISAKQALQLSLIFPALMVVALLLASLLGWRCGSKFCGNCSTHWANCSLCLMFMNTVLGFLIVAGIFWPVLLALGDGCQSANGLAYKYAAGGDLCDQLGGVGTNQACVVDLTNRNTITVDIPAVMTSLASGECGAGTGITNLWADLRTQTAEIPKLYITDRLGDPDDALLSKVGPTLRPLIEAFATRLTGSLSRFVNSAQDHAGCAAMSGSYRAVVDSVCCTTFASFYWMVAGWYLILWTILLCAIPAALLGRKRFNGYLWGPMFEAHHERLLQAALKNDQQAAEAGLDGDSDAARAFNGGEARSPYANTPHAYSSGHVYVADNAPGSAPPRAHVLPASAASTFAAGSVYGMSSAGGAAGDAGVELAPLDKVPPPGYDGPSGNGAFAMGPIAPGPLDESPSNEAMLVATVSSGAFNANEQAAQEAAYAPAHAHTPLVGNSGDGSYAALEEAPVSPVDYGASAPYASNAAGNAYAASADNMPYSEEPAVVAHAYGEAQDDAHGSSYVAQHDGY